MKNKDMSFLKYIFLIVSILLVFLGIVLINKHTENKKYFKTTQAVIVDIVTDVNIDIYEDASYSETDHYVYVDYVVDGVDYNDVLLNRYDATMYIGKTILVDYDIRNPLNLDGKNTYLILSLVSIGVGTVMGAVCLISIVKKGKNRVL